MCHRNSFVCRFESIGDLSDIYQAVDAHQKAVDATSEGHPDLPSWLNSLGLSLMHRFEAEEDPTDIDEAISFQKRAVDLTAQGHAELANRLNNLANSLTCRFEWKRTEDLSDINEAIEAQQKAVHLTPHDHADMLMWLSCLGSTYITRYEFTGEFADVCEGISAITKSIDLTPHDHPSRPLRLGNLGAALSRRFGHSGNIVDISEAISSLQKAIHCIPEGSLAGMPGMLTTLGVCFLARFERTRDVADNSEAISCHQKALELTPAGYPGVSKYLNNIGHSFVCRYEQTREISDITQAIAFQQRAVGLTSEDHPQMANRLNNLGASFMRRFECNGSLDDISEAILCQKKAVDLAPEEYSGRSSWFNNLGNSLLSRFEAAGDLADLAEAVSYQESAINLTPDGHADMPMRLNSLGLSILRRFEQNGDPKDIQICISHYRRAACYTSGPPSLRLDAAKQWAQLSRKYDLSSSLEANRVAIALLSQVAGLEQTVTRRHSILNHISTVSTSAAAAAFSQGRSDLALEWLEQGRCLVWTQISNLRTPLYILRGHDEALADNFLRVSRGLERAGSRAVAEYVGPDVDMASKISFQDEAHIHVKLAQEMEQLLEKIRSISGFDFFLRPPSVLQLFDHLPPFGTVVVINVDEDRCDALALRPGDNVPRHIPLEQLTWKKADQLRNQLSRHLTSYGARIPVRQSIAELGGSIVHNILEELWVLVVEPILYNLELLDPVSQELPRIWWCSATGPLAFLPIHAAGNYVKNNEKPQISVSDFVISSYTPTVTSLNERVKGNRQSSIYESNGLLIVGQENTPGLTPLPGTIKEVRTIEEILTMHGAKYRLLEKSEATMEQVLTNIASHSCIHLACHAIQDLSEPLHSGFHLHDGRLKLSELIRNNLPCADLAYLSACQTCTGEEGLSEEAVHLAAGMLTSGYQGAVAAMWSIKDWHAPKVAEYFYAHLLKNGEYEGRAVLSGAGAARALHYAMKRLRDELDDSDKSLLVWVPYVHFGL